MGLCTDPCLSCRTSVRTAGENRTNSTCNIQTIQPVFTLAMNVGTIHLCPYHTTFNGLTLVKGNKIDGK